MGFAAHNSGGQVRFGLSSTAAAAVLYSAVVIFGLGPATPFASGTNEDRSAPVVRVPPHEPAVSGPVRRLPQASPGPARHRTVTAGRHAAASVRSGRPATGPPRQNTTETPPSAPTSPPSASKSSTKVTSTKQTAPSGPSADLPTVTVTVPDLPVTIPTVTLPSSPVNLPSLPATPPLHLP